MIYKRPAEIQKALKAPKNQHNKFGGYDYRSLEDIVEAIKPLLKDDETVRFVDDVVLIGDRYYTRAEAIFQKGTDIVVTRAYARESENKKGMDDAQVSGSTSSYARKYAANGLFLIDDAKDPDYSNNRSHEEKPQAYTEIKRKTAATELKGTIATEGVLLIPTDIRRSDLNGKTWYFFKDVEGAESYTDNQEVADIIQSCINERLKVKCKGVISKKEKLFIKSAEIIP